MENNLKNSIDYLNKKTNGLSGFSVPSTYFNEVENNFILKLKENNFPKTKGFEIPKEYFKNLDNTILSKVKKTKKETKTNSFKQRVIKMLPLAAAASVLLFIGLNSFIFNNQENLSFDNLPDNEVDYWITNNINLINDNDVAIAYTDVEFEESELIPNSITNDDLEDYLSNLNNLSIILEND